MKSWKIFLLVLNIFLNDLRPCNVEDPERAVGLNSSSQSIHESSKAVNEQNKESIQKGNAASSVQSSSTSSISSAISSSQSISGSSSSSSSSSSTSLSNSVDGISTSELEQLVLPTVAPATPHFDIETVSTTLQVQGSNTEAIQQEKHKQEQQKSPPDLIPNVAIKGASAERQTQEEQQKVTEKNPQEKVDDRDSTKESVVDDKNSMAQKSEEEEQLKREREKHVPSMFLQPENQCDENEKQVKPEKLNAVEEKKQEPKPEIMTREQEEHKEVKESVKKEIKTQIESTREGEVRPENTKENLEETKDEKHSEKEEKQEQKNEKAEGEKKQEKQTEQRIEVKEEKEQKREHIEEQDDMKEQETRKEDQDNKERQEKKEELQEKKEERQEKKEERQEKIEEQQAKEEKKEETREELKKEAQAADDKDEDSITAGLKQAEQEPKTPSEDMPSFDEFRRQLQQEEEKQKSLLQRQKEEQTKPSGNNAKPKPKKRKERKQNNYASVDCGAKVLGTNPEATNIFSILQENRDIYMLNPCTAKIWFIVELCDTAQVRRIDIANYELFSSTPESFRVFVSGRYPTREWTLLGTFQARDERTLQSFPLEEPIYAKYFKVEMLSHFGKEHYCPISLFRVFGTSMMEELEDHEAGSQDDGDSVDHDDDIIQVIPHDSSAKSDDKTKQPNILATVGDTLMNMVKHAAKKLTGVIKDTDGNNTGDQDKEPAVSTVAHSSSIVSSMVFKQQQQQDSSKPSIVTLIPSEEEDEHLSLNRTSNETASGSNNTTAKHLENVENATNANSSFYERINLDTDKGHKSTSSFTYCKTIVRMLGHSGFGCFMGRVLYSKRKHQHGFTPKEKVPKARQSNTVKDSIINSVDVGKTDTKTDTDKKDAKDSEDDNEKKSEKVNEKEKETKAKLPNNEKPEEKLKDSTNILQSIDNTDKQTIETINDKSSSTDDSKEIKATPSINRQPMNVSSLIEPSESQQSMEQLSERTTESTPSIDNISSLKTEPAQESSKQTEPTPDSKPTLDQVQKSTDESSSSSNQTTSTEDVQSSSSEAVTKKEGESNTESESKSTVKVTIDACTSIDSDNHLLIKASPPPSKCAAPTVMPSLKDVDILEFKLLDSTGREGTAHLEKPVIQEKPVQPDKPVDDTGKKQEDEEKNRHGEEKKSEDEDKKGQGEEKKGEEKMLEEKGEKNDFEHVSENEKPLVVASESSKVDESKTESSTSSLVEPSKAEPIVVVSTPTDGRPTQPPPPVKQEEKVSIPPIAAPPVVPENPNASPDNSRVPPVNIEASLVDEVTKPSSSAVNQGFINSGAQKESIFMRLTNRIKALEQNLTLSTLYMEKLNQKYRKMVEDMQKNFDKKVNLLTNATIKAENIVKKQKEQIALLQSKLDDIQKEVKQSSKKLSNLNKDVMERHIIGLFLEVIFIIMLFIVFRRWDRARFRRDILRDSLRNGTIPTSRHIAVDSYPEQRNTLLKNGQVFSAREQLHRSFSVPIVPENVGTLNDVNLQNRHKENHYPTHETKKKRNRKRPKSAILPSESIPSSNSAPELTDKNQANQSSAVNATAGLLFSPARGLLNGISDSLRLSRSVSLDDSHMYHRPVSGLSSNGRLPKAKSLDVIHENTAVPPINKKGRIPIPPPLPPTNGIHQKRLPGQLPSNRVNRK